MKKILIVLMAFVFSYASCENRLFTLKVLKPVKLSSLIESFVGECDTDIVFGDFAAKNYVEHAKINYLSVKNVTYKELIKAIFEKTPLMYTFKNNKLTLKYYDTKIFKIGYIPNTITGNSNLELSNTNISNKFESDFWSKIKTDIITILINTADNVSEGLHKSIIERTLKDMYNRPDDVYNYKKEVWRLEYRALNSLISADNQLPVPNTKKLNYGIFYYQEPIINKTAGMITVTGTKRQLKYVGEYINKLKTELSREVFIDVRIYSVELSNSHKTGIDWTKLSMSIGYKKDSYGKLVEDFVSVPVSASNIFGKTSIIKSAQFNVSGLLNFLSQFGNVNTISNPKIVTLNGQKSIINLGSKYYYKYIQTYDTDKDGNKIPVYTIGNQFVGISLDITPQINSKGYITLSINPKITYLIDQYADFNNLTTPPNIKERSLMSVVKLKNGETLVLGGLISKDKYLKVNGVPVLKEIPLIKYLFSSKEKITTRKELVFVITPHIIYLDKKASLKDYGYKKLPSLEELNVK